MEDPNQRGLDRYTSLPSSSERGVELHNMTEQAKDERIVSANASVDAAISRASRNAKEQLATLETSGVLTTINPSNSYTPEEQGYYFGGYNNWSGNWDEHSNYVNANNLHAMPPALYNDNSSLFFPSDYAYDSQMAHGQLLPLGGPLSPTMFDGQLFPLHQMPVPLPYYPLPVSPGPPHVTSGFPDSQTELLPSRSSSQENLIDNTFFGPGSSYYLPFGSFGGGDLSGSSGLGVYKFPGEFVSNEPLPTRSSSLDMGNFVSPLTGGNAYPQPFGVLGSYEQNVGQGFGLTSNSSAMHFSHGGSYQGAVGDSSNRIRYAPNRGGRRERNRDTFGISTNMLGTPNELNRGPRSLKPKSENSLEEGSSSHIRDVESTSRFHVNHFNSPEFVIDYENAKFFVVKSFSEDNIHRSIKYNVWASTTLGNKKLDAAYREARETEGICPVFLFFSVNASGQFCGVAEMVGPVDFDNDADYWQQDRWSGQFPVKWHIIKDIPNSLLRHILLENNDNKPVTHSRDSQEVKLEQGIEMLKIFKSYDAEMSLLDDFNFYDEREKSLMERKTKMQASTIGNTTTLDKEPINQLSGSLAETLRLDGGESLSKSDLV